MTKLDLNKFPLIENSIGFLAFNHLKEFPVLATLGDITQRIYGCSNFLYYRSDEKNLFYIESAYLRAALNEFSSISEMVKVSSIKKFKDLTIENLDYPLFHFFKLLREINFHLNSLRHNTTTSDVKTFNTNTGEIDDKVITLSP